jgi:CBS domain-containing protein
VLAYLTAINVFVLVFNLIPGYPMDGGRLVRALVWWRTGDRNRSTRFAARMGRVVGWLVILYGVYVLLQDQLISGVWWAFIGMFLSQAARSAEAQAEFAGRIEHIRVADVMDAEPVAIPESMSLDQAEDDFFLRYGWPWFPVVDSAGRLVGVVSREALHSVDDAVRGAKPVGSVMARDDGESGLRARTEDPLEALLGLESLARLGAVMAVDADGVLRGVVTLEQVRRALKPAV